MKAIDIGSSIGLDRFATWQEVMCAISTSAEGTFSLVREGGELREEDSDLSVGASNFSEDDIWLAIARDMSTSKSN